MARPINHEKRQRQQEEFLVAFARTGLAINAAQEVGIPAPYHYRWLKEDPEYAQRFAAIKEQTRDLAAANRKQHYPPENRTGRRPDLKEQERRKAAFLATLAKTGIVMDAAEEVGVYPAEFYRLCRLDPEFQQKAQQVIEGAQRQARALTADRTGAAARAMWERDGFREHMSQQRRELWTSPEMRAAAGERSQQRWDDPEWRATEEEARRVRSNTPEARARNSERMKGLWADPEHRERYLETINTPDLRALRAEAARKQWAALTPGERKERMRALRSVFKGGHRLTKIEAAVLTELNDRDLPYFTHKYLDGYVADVLIPSLNLVVECDGSWFHPQRQEADAGRDEALRALGYETLRLSEDEINSKDWARLDAEIARLSQQ